MKSGFMTRRRFVAATAAWPVVSVADTKTGASTDGSVSRAPVKAKGTVAAGYESVRSAFESNLASGLDRGATFAVYRNGVPLVDLWGGNADEANTIEVSDRTLFCVYSVTKGLTALCMAMLVDRGKIAYEAPVASYWPQFAAKGKAAITVGQMLSHQAGLVGTRTPATIEQYYDHHAIAAALAAQEPFFSPGSWGYHAFTFGTLADELVRRTDGRTIQRFFADEVEPRFGGDVFMALPAAEDRRYVWMGGLAGQKTIFFDFPDPAAAAAAVMNPPVDLRWANDRRFRESGLPGTGACANARGLAKFYASLVADEQKGEAPLVRRAVLREATRERISGVDRALGGVGRYAAGFRLNSGTMGSNMDSFGHPGMGGSMAFADPSRKLGVAYTTNSPINPNWQGLDPRLAGLLSALYSVS